MRGFVPWLTISSRFQPAPTPKSTRPPERWSRLATSFAVMIGSRSVTRQMPLPTRSDDVAASDIAIATNRSYVCAYLRGSGGAPSRPLHGVSRLAGMCVCSANISQRCPRASTSRASSPGGTASWVGK